MEYQPISIEPAPVTWDLEFKRGWEKRGKRFDSLCERLPGLKFYLSPILKLYGESSRERIQAELAKWEASAPRPVQRMDSLGEDESENIIHFGLVTGTGKTTAAYEHIWRDYGRSDSRIAEPNIDWPIAMTGHQFARRVASQAKDLDGLMEELTAADWLLLDDLDKRGDKDGKFSPIVQQTLFDLIEARTVGDQITILTLNSNGEELLRKFNDDIGPYLLRRLRERFRSIDFDPELTANNILQIKTA